MKHIFLSAILFFSSAFCANAQCNKLYDFSGAADGSYPHGSLISDGTFLYGMTNAGGANNLGVIFKIKSDGTNYTKLLDFSGTANGSNPQTADGSLISDGTFLYGVTNFGGIYNQGVLFKIMPDGSGFSKLIDFMGNTNGANPNGTLFYDGLFLYGMTIEGGINDEGVIYKIKPDGTSFVKLLDLSSTLTGKNPLGSFVSDGTYLYGMTLNGGASSYGTIFKIKKDGSLFNKLLDFSGSTNGSMPQGSLIYDGTYLYGTTTKGGIACGTTDGCGIIFKLKTDGTAFSIIMDFPAGIYGSNPFGTLYYDGTYLYGTTTIGGASTMGTLFKIKPDGTSYSSCIEFSGTVDGVNPYGSVFSDGVLLYGMAAFGGTNNLGTIFSFGTAATGILETKNNLSLDIYPNPSNKFFTIDFQSSAKTELSLKIRNAQGTLVYEETKKDFSGEYHNQINLSKQSKGIYFVEINSDNERAIKKLIIE